MILPHIKIRNQGNIFVILAKTEPFNFKSLLSSPSLYFWFLFIVTTTFFYNALIVFHKKPW